MSTERLARYVAGTGFSTLPRPVIDEAVRSLVNWAGCALGGGRHESVDIALASLGPFAGPAHATLLGRKERSDCLLAALANGIASHVLDFDDTHPETLVHPSGCVAAALLPLAEWRSASGEDLVNAFVAGVEVECRVARAVLPAHYEVGWHITGTAGAIGAAAACARLLGLEETRTAWALGIAATQAAGLREMFGSMCKSFHVGRAAQHGLVGALLAQRGFTSAPAALEGARGFVRVLSSSPHPEALAAGLGMRYELLGNTYKPFACGLVIHPSLDGCLRLREAHALRAADIERVDLVVNPLALELTGKPAPRTGLEGKFSVFHAAAAALIDGAGGEAQFNDARVNASEVVALRGKVHARADAGLRVEEAQVTVALAGGARHSVHVDACVGSAQHPLSDAQLDAKFLDLARPVLGHRSEAALAALRSIPRAADVAALIREHLGAH